MSLSKRVTTIVHVDRTVGREELQRHGNVHELRDGPGGLLFFKYYHPVFDMFDDPIQYQVFDRDPVLKERARLAAEEKKRLLPFLLVDDPSEIRLS